MAIKILTVIDNVDQMLKQVAALTQAQALVGVPSNRSDRRGGPISNAALAYIHDQGSPAANIPARPFMEPGIKNAQADISAYLADGATAALGADRQGATAGLRQAGLAASVSIKKVIQSDVPPPLAASTVAARRRKKNPSDKTLIVTGQMRNSITYVIRNKGQ